MTDIGEGVLLPATTSGVELETIVAQERIGKYVFDVRSGVNFFIKNNVFVGQSAYVDVNTNTKKPSPLSKMEMMVLQTAFCMAHQINQQSSKKNYDAETEFTIGIDSFAEFWKIPDAAMRLRDGSLLQSIKRAIVKIDSRRFEYQEMSSEREAVVLSGYFGSVKFIKRKDNSTELAFTFPKDIIPYLKNYGQFTWYYFENIINLQDYPNAISLYEIFCKHKNKIKRLNANDVLIEVSIEKLKKALSVSGGYDNTDFIRKIIKPSIERINSFTSLYVEPDFVINKMGRNLDSISFEVHFSEADLNFQKACTFVNEQKVSFTSAQAEKFSRLLCELKEFDEMYRHKGEADHEFLARINEDLFDLQKVFEYYQYLRIVGMSNKAIDARMNQK